MSMSKRGSLASELAKGILAGVVATWMMERVTTYLYEHENPEARRREDDARQGKHAYAVAAEKTASLIGVQLSDEQQQTLGMVYHWGLGLGAGAVYAALRRRVDWLESGRGTAFGFLFFILVDEVLNIALGLTPPPQAYPWQAHARGLAGHLTYGVVADTALNALNRAKIGR
jgi:hypothetical protein